MKKGLRILLLALAAVVFTVTVFLLDSGSRRERMLKTCSRLDVVVLDSTEMQFVTKSDVRKILLQDYGAFIGQRLDSVNLRKIEEVLEGRSGILGSEAYLTDDGILHIEITQRAPILMFETAPGTGFFADEKGYLFPLMKGYSEKVTKVEGKIPVAYEGGYKGFAKTAKERKWIVGMVSMAHWLEGNRAWESAIKRISVDAKGCLLLHPRVGNETFVFGRPEEFKEKFRRIELYYKKIAPNQEEGKGYRYVDVSIDGQIICRRKK